MTNKVFDDVVSAVRFMFKLLSSGYLVYLPFAIGWDPAITSLGDVKLGFDATLCLIVAMFVGLVGLVSCLFECCGTFGPRQGNASAHGLSSGSGPQDGRASAETLGSKG
jgi:hypothetical protein